MLVSAVLKYEKIKHCSGGTTFFLLALVNLLTSQTFYPRQLMVSCLVCIWALRLAVYLMIRAYSVEASHKISVAFAVDADPRQPPNTVLHRVVFWMVQIVWISVVSLPVILVSLDYRPSQKLHAECVKFT
ncbi:hypothetical protein RvY_07682-3 [Ramazzottius varieornatus]|uniref:Uncharacterized protein n=1 Tax=Ramazzottius varieornatus TaxID=947166 RepID=A0A1D1V3A2_RAMVA|nr:hypothetical protein RvY_07682-3 [Ramazzottius varieornatus]